MGKECRMGRCLKRFWSGITPSFLYLLMVSVGWAAPTVTTVFPPDGGQAPPDTTITAVFSDAMDPASITTGSFTVSAFVPFKAVAAGGAHSMALKEDGTVVAWGYNDYGQCNVPPGLARVTAIAAGNIHSVALLDNGTVVAWGGNGYGQCDVPPGLPRVTAIAAGAYHNLALLENGTVIAWGDNSKGQCDIPYGLTGVIAVAADAASEHSLALRSGGTVVAWGYNIYGQCNVPSDLAGVTAIAAGGSHSVVLRDDNTVAAWGNNVYGQSTVPADLSGVVAVAAGTGHTLALRSDGTVAGWGWNYYGQSSIPWNLSGVTAIAAGNQHNLVLRYDGTLFGWGYDRFSQSAVPSPFTSVEGTVDYDNVIRRAAFSPLALLVPGPIYFATVNSGARSATGVPLAADVCWSFTVGDFVPPVVMGTVPLDNAVDVPPNQVITVTFSENIQVVPPESNILLYDEKRFLPVDRTLSVSGNVLTITPVGGLIKNTTYSVNISNFSIQDLAGNEMVADEIFYFITVKK